VSVGVEGVVVAAAAGERVGRHDCSCVLGVLCSCEGYTVSGCFNGCCNGGR
jgi:hypothetical protein